MKKYVIYNLQNRSYWSDAEMGGLWDERVLMAKLFDNSEDAQMCIDSNGFTFCTIITIYS